MNRRNTIFSALSLIFASGCTSPKNGNNKPVGLLLENNFDETKVVEVSVSEADVVYNETYEIDGQSKVSRKRILEAGNYSVTISVEGLGEMTEDWGMNGCKENDIHALFNNDTIVIGATCYDD